MLKNCSRKPVSGIVRAYSRNCTGGPGKRCELQRMLPMGLMGLMRPKNALIVPTVTLAAP